MAGTDLFNSCGISAALCTGNTLANMFSIFAVMWQMCNDADDEDAEVVDGNVCTRPVMTYKLSVVAGEYAQPE